VKAMVFSLISEGPLAPLAAWVSRVNYGASRDDGITAEMPR